MSITKQVENYIAKQRPLKDSLQKGLINYSALARFLIDQLSLEEKDFDAVLISCRRYFEKLQKQKAKDDPVQEILRNSKLEIKNKKMAFVLSTEVSSAQITKIGEHIKSKKETYQLVESPSGITLITSEDFAAYIEKQVKYSLIKKNEKLVEVVIKSPKDIETTPGVMTHLFSLLSDQSINVAEFLSCWTDTIFLVKEQDMGRVMEIMRF